MTLVEFRDLLLLADPRAMHYGTTHTGDYTIWTEYGSSFLAFNNRYCNRIWKIQVDRFTRKEYDPLVDEIASVLDQGEVTFSYLCDYEPDSKYIHHIWDCEVLD